MGFLPLFAYNLREIYMKIVLDTNVLINGLKDEYSYEKRIINEVIAGNIEAYANQQTLDENRLIARQLIASSDYLTDLRNYFTQVNRVINRHTIHVVIDEEDNKILESAVEAGADYLISTDNDLLNIKSFQGVTILTPAAFWVRYKDEDKDQWQSWVNYVNSQRE